MSHPESLENQTVQASETDISPIQKHERPTRNKQTTSEILMIQPTGFRFNFQTARDNQFQLPDKSISPEEIELLANDRQKALADNPDLAARVAKIDAIAQKEALIEFNMLVEALREKFVSVYTMTDDPSKDTPDSIFPNNPISFHQEGNGTVVQYLMKHDNRKPETQLPIVETLTQRHNFQISKTVDLRETKGPDGLERPLEGTGSMVLDRENGIVYACLSERTTTEGLTRFAKEVGYEKVVTFTSKGTELIKEGPKKGKQKDVYHTNVMMSVGKNFALICFDSIPDPAEQEMVRKSLENTGKDIIEITLDQMNSFAGNMLEIADKNGNPLIAMSAQARDVLTPEQLEALERHGEIISSDISSIERNGGGSVRCMLAEIHLPKNNA